MKYQRVFYALITMILVLTLGLSVGAEQEASFLVSLGLSEAEAAKIEAQCKVNGYIEELVKEIDETKHGGFLIDEKNTLHVYLVPNTNETKTMRRIQRDPDVVFHECTYSFRDLQDIQDTVLEQYGEEWNVVRSYIDVQTNRVVIEMPVSKMDNGRRTRSGVRPDQPLTIVPVGDSDTFDVKLNASTSAVEIYPSNQYTNRSTWSSATIGFFARERSGSKRYGFVTAGHAVGVGNVLEMWGESIGTCVKSTTDKVDCAFVALNSGVEGYSMIDYGSGLGTKQISGYTRDNYVKGKMYICAGGESGIVSGECENVSVVVGGFFKNRQALFSFKLQEGDSGSPILYASSPGGRTLILNGMSSMGEASTSKGLGYTMDELEDTLGVDWVQTVIL